MAKFTLDCPRCGSAMSFTVANARQVDYRRKQLEEKGHVCGECNRKAMIERHAEETAKASVVASETGLPPLVGTEKQIAYGEVMRGKVLEKIDEKRDAMLSEVRSWGAPEDVTDDFVSGLAKLEAELRGETEASIWIDLGQDKQLFRRQPFKMISRTDFVLFDLMEWRDRLKDLAPTAYIWETQQ